MSTAEYYVEFNMGFKATREFMRENKIGTKDLITCILIEGLLKKELKRQFPNAQLVLNPSVLSAEWKTEHHRLRIESDLIDSENPETVLSTGLLTIFLFLHQQNDAKRLTRLGLVTVAIPRSLRDKSSDLTAVDVSLMYY